MNMYVRTWNLLHTPEGLPGTQFHNPLYESHLLHLRNLIDFFNTQNSMHEDDIILSKVLTNTDNYSIEISTDFREAINKTVQHLSTYRADFLDKRELSANVTNIYPIVYDRICRFKSDIKNPSNLKEKYRKDYKEYIEQDNHFI